MRRPGRGVLVTGGLVLAVGLSIWRLDLISAFAEGSDGLAALLDFLARFAAPDLSGGFLAKVSYNFV